MQFRILATLLVLLATGPAGAQSPLAKLEGLRGFVYVEPFEIRKEFVIPLHEVAGALGLAPSAPLDSPARDEVLENLRKRLAASCPVSADGAPLVFSLDRIQFVVIDPAAGVAPDTRDPIPASDATVAAVYVVTRESPPARLEITWDLFPDGGGEVPVGLEASTGTSMEFFDHLLTFSSTNSTQAWDLPALGAAPALLAVSAPPRARPLPFVAAGLALLLGAGVLFARSGGPRAPGRRPARLAAVLLSLGGALLLLRALLPANHAALGDEEARAVVDALLRNIYHSFAYRDESRVFDTLAASVAGGLLEELYLDIRRGLELENAGGPRVKIHRVRLEECTPDTSGTAPGFRAEARWTAAGNVSHWGHIHPRRNKYHGELTVEPVDGRWKVTRVQILEEERI